MVLIGLSGCQFGQKPFAFSGQRSSSFRPTLSYDTQSEQSQETTVASNTQSDAHLATLPNVVLSSDEVQPTATVTLASTETTTASDQSSTPNQNVILSDQAVVRGQSGNLPTPGTSPQTPIYDTPGYGSPGGVPAYQPPANPGYANTLAPGATGGYSGEASTLAPGTYQTPGPGFDSVGITAPDVMNYRPIERIAPIDVNVQEARTGRIILGGAVNSDLGVSGNLIIEERNFDIFRYPRSWDDVMSGRAFRGGGQNFRAELMPGSQVQRYTVSLTEPFLGNSPYSLSVGGFLFTRIFRDWTEQRLGGRVALGYEITRELSITSELRMEDVKLFDARVAGVPELEAALGSNDVYRGRVRLTHDTRDNFFMPSEGARTELIYDQVFGEFDYSRGEVNHSRYFTVHERADGGGKHIVASTMRLGFTGAQTPIFDNFFAGGYSTMRGFSFRGASPVVNDVQVGGEFSMLGSLEYVMPITADEMLRAVAFVDYGTVEQDIELNWDNFRVAPGFGLRVNVAALGPAPLAFDFAFPVAYADTDDRQVFSFFMGLTRQ